ncbi:MAG: hypothetical protein E7354_00110 [Clostridiales bacterium]|nr:hypothetical protein [Clostridiales bacterium]
MNEYEVYKEFLKFEEKNKLFDYTYKGIKIWDYTRYNFYKILCTNYLGLFNQIQRPIKPENVQTNDYIKERLMDIDKLGHYDILIMGNPRRVKQADGYYYDIYTDYIPDLIDDYSSLVVEDPFWNQFSHNKESHLTPAISKNLIYTDNLVRYFYDCYFDDNAFAKEKEDLKAIFTEISQIFAKTYNFDYEIAIINATLLSLFIIITEEEYCRLLKQTSPKAVLFIFHPNPSCLALLHCAKKLGIPIAEIQHGIFGEFEPIWHKFGNTNREYMLPDYVLALSPRVVFENDMAMTAANGKLKYVGYPLLERKIEEYKDVKEDTTKKNILFVSQTNIGETFSRYAAELADLLKDKPEYHIIYKLHPFELKKVYPHLNKENITVINNLDQDIYYFAKKSRFQIGVYSTAIYEAVQFGVTTLIADDIMGGKEALKILDGLDGVYSATTPKDAYDIIMSNPPITSIDNPLWPRVNKETYTKAIEDIINKR